MPANTGEAGAMHRVAYFAGSPAPTGRSTSIPVGFQPFFFGFRYFIKPWNHITSAGLPLIWMFLS